MYRFKNELIESVDLKKDSIFIAALGYETRSTFLYEKYFSKLSDTNILLVVIKNKELSKSASEVIDGIKDTDIKVVETMYENYEETINTILDFLKERIEVGESGLDIHIDYSSMPRAWYCRLPMNIMEVKRQTDLLRFWYSEGNYPTRYRKFPTAGIESHELFSGRPSLDSDRGETYIIGLGFDSVRTNATLSLLDPNSLITCYQYETSNLGRCSEILRRNKDITIRSWMNIGFPMEDFTHTISKLCEAAFESFRKRDVVFIPDGPKPLILAMSLAPILTNKVGITSLHLKRNFDAFSVVDVIPNNKVHGFSLTKVE